MTASDLDREPAHAHRESNVVQLRPRLPAKPQQPDLSPTQVDVQRFPVDVRGDVTLGRLMSGLSSVGLTVRLDIRSGCIVISDQ